MPFTLTFYPTDKKVPYNLACLFEGVIYLFYGLDQCERFAQSHNVAYQFAATKM
jgi:hypothetical protein